MPGEELFDKGHDPLVGVLYNVMPCVVKSVDFSLGKELQEAIEKLG
jgi:hypothetical protein